MNRLILVRHGQSLIYEKHITSGFTNEPLSDFGREQAHLTGKHIAELKQDNEKCGLYCSDLKRAKETAQIIGSYLSLKPEESNALRDLNNGDAANISKQEAKLMELPITEPLMDWIYVGSIN